jgi:hypothetical protein
MYPSTFAHLRNDYAPPMGDSRAPAPRTARRASATLPLWRNRPSLIRVLLSQR